MHQNFAIREGDGFFDSLTYLVEKLRYMAARVQIEGRTTGGDAAFAAHLPMDGSRLSP